MRDRALCEQSISRLTLKHFASGFIPSIRFADIKNHGIKDNSGEPMSSKLGNHGFLARFIQQENLTPQKAAHSALPSHCFTRASGKLFSTQACCAGRL